MLRDYTKRLLLTLVLIMNCSLAQENDYLMTFEELSQIQVTSFDTQERTVAETPAGVYIITAEDIAKSQHTSLPELLRDAPGIHVASIDSNNWAIGLRGLNRRFANKLLVLIDGRRIFTPISTGVNWGTQNIPLADIEQIEIIRGPGASLWGANAVNGVINVITKKATQTKGTLIQAGTGNYERLQSFIRYGAKTDEDFFYRLSLQQIHKDHFTVLDGSTAKDAWRETHFSTRFDWFPALEHEISFDSQHYYGHRSFIQPYVDDRGRRQTLEESALNSIGHSLRARWDHESGANSYYLQSYLDYYKRDRAGREEEARTLNLDFRHKHSINQFYNLSWGSSLFYIYDKTQNNDDIINFFPPDNHQFRSDLFFQNDIILIENKLDLSLGTKLGYNEDTNFELQPSLRLHYSLNDNHHLWTAVSRPVRIPSKSDINLSRRLTVIPARTPIEVILRGGDVKAEELLVYEFGYKHLGEESSFDLTFFYNDYKKFNNIISDPNQRFSFIIDDSLTGYSYGIESNYKQKLSEKLQININYSYLDSRFNFQNRFDNAFTGINVQHLASLSTDYHLSHKLLHRASLYYTDQFTARNNLGKVGSNLRLDTGFIYNLNDKLRLEIWAMNLLENRTTEFADSASNIAEVPRTFFAKISYHF